MTQVSGLEPGHVIMQSLMKLKEEKIVVEALFSINSAKTQKFVFSQYIEQTRIFKNITVSLI